MSIKNKKLKLLLGDIFQTEDLIFDSEKLIDYEKNTLAISKKIRGVVFPNNQSQIIKLIKLANQESIKLYPVSTGHNWGYGCMQPSCEDAIVVNLSKMVNIEIIDPELGLFSIEPGVTQEKMIDFLEHEGLNFIIPTTGAGPSCSLIGNALERGFGLAPISNHFSSIVKIDAVFGSGEIYRNAFEDYNCSLISNYHSTPPGPDIKALFSQSNFSIVTSATIQLVPKVTEPQILIASVKQEDDLPKLIDAFKEIKKRFPGMITSANISNSTRVEYTLENNKKSQLNQGFLSNISKWLIDPSQFEWTMIGPVYCDITMNSLLCKTLKKISKAHGCHVKIFNLNKVEKLRTLITKIPFLKKSEFVNYKIQQLISTINIITGYPTTAGLKLAYAKKNKKHDVDHVLNPSLDDVGLRWLAPLVPIDVKKAIEFCNIIKHVSKKHDFPNIITLTTISNSSFDGTIPIYFNKNDPYDIEKASLYFDDLFTSLHKAGFFPYRLDINVQRRIISDNLQHWKLAKAIKNELDPNGVIAPGRYNIE